MEPEGSYRVHNSPPLVPILSQTHPVHTLPPYFTIQWVPGVKWPRREADHSPPYVFIAWCLDKYRDNFTFTFSNVLQDTSSNAPEVMTPMSSQIPK
jgi:hypothetical protein